MRILVVDDEVLLRHLLVSFLFRLGHQHVIEASGVRVALELFNRHPVDLVITDWNMPIHTGKDLIKGIRSRGNEEVHFLVTSGSAVGANDLEELGLDHSNFIAKPFNLRVLETKIQRLSGEADPAT